MRKLLLGMCMAALLLPAALSAQDATPEATAAPEPWTCPSGFEGQTLSVYNWSTYVAENTISNFEAACGVTVNYDVYGNNEELLARLRQGNPGYDIIVPTDYMVEIMIGEGLLEPLDHSAIPNLANLGPTFQDPVYDPGNQFSVPYQWGTIGVGYNKDVVGEITSWDDVWNYQGPVAWLDDQRVMLGIALNNLGLDPNTQNPDDIAQARDYLLERGDNVVYFAADDGQAQLLGGNVDIAIEYSGDIFQIMAECECDSFAYAIPAEGTNLWTDNLAIPTGAPNPALATVFIDYILDPQVGADISNFIAYGSPNQLAIDLGLILPELLNDPAIYPPEDIMARMFSLVGVPDAETDYSYAWDEIRVMLGG